MKKRWYGLSKPTAGQRRYLNQLELRRQRGGRKPSPWERHNQMNLRFAGCGMLIWLVMSVFGAMNRAARPGIQDGGNNFGRGR